MKKLSVSSTGIGSWRERNWHRWVIASARRSVAAARILVAALASCCVIQADAGSHAVPLDFPAERSGLPLPVALVNIGTAFGAAGRGWEVPLSYITENGALMYRTPTSAAGAPPAVPLQVNLILLGDTMELIPSGADWVPRVGSSALTAKKQLNSTTGDLEWLVYDGAGLTYTFTMERPDFWLLSRLDGPGEAHVDLGYKIELPLLSARPGGPTYSVMTVDLEKVAYNHSASGVPKHEVSLVYGASSGTPLSLEFIGGHENLPGWYLGRTRTLERIEVRSRPSTGAALQTLSTYQLNYGTDPDTEQRQLASVTMKGQQDTPEADEVMPVVRYEYGTATAPKTSGGRELAYGNAEPLELPAGWSGGPISLSAVVPTTPWELDLRTLTDFTGDGRADVLTGSLFGTGGLDVARNRPDGAGRPVLNDPNLFGTVNGGQMNAYWTSEHFGDLYDLYDDDDLQHGHLSSTFSQMIDVNGDGRLDYISAKEETGYKWVVYLNTPASNAPGNTHWVRMIFDVSHLKDELEARGHAVYDQGSDSYLPLGQTATIEYIPGTLDFDDQPVHSLSVEAWRLGDFNGDSRLDLLMEAHAPRARKREGSGHPGFWGVPEGALAVVYGTGSSLVPSSAASEIAGSCGVQRLLTYRTYPKLGDKMQYAICDLLDINADGLLDSVDYADDPNGIKEHLYEMLEISDDAAVVENSVPVAYLGNGAGFSNGPALILPGPTRVDVTDCDTSQPQGERTSEAQAGYFDLTGDGIPDYLSGTANNRLVRIGSGVSFGSVLPTTAGLRTTKTGCEDSRQIRHGARHYSVGWSKTTSELVDVDGDGRVEIVEAGEDGWSRRELVGRRGGLAEPRALSAGELIAIENGHGARTEITYESAKDDNSTPHQVPSPEIVVGEVKTIVATIAADRTTVTRYAYGNPIFGFDTMRDGFRSYGYGRTVAMTKVKNGRSPESVQGNVVITDSHRLEALSNYADISQAFDRHLLAGRPSTVTTLSGEFPVDPWTLLTVDVAGDPRRTGATSYTYDSVVDEHAINPAQHEVQCRDELNPYDPTGAISLMNVCTTRGLLYTKSVTSWEGTQDPQQGDDNIWTKSQVKAVDGFGRVTRVHLLNDLRRFDDDLCVDTSYAVPPADEFPRVLDAAAQTQTRILQDGAICGQVLAQERFEYDQKPWGEVGANGFLTSHEAQRIEVGSGDVLDTIRSFDATYDDRGHVLTVTHLSGDGRTATTTSTAFDAFDLTTTATRVEATGAAALESSVELDDLTMLPLSVTDANGLTAGVQYDGFGRPVVSTVTPPGGTVGAMSYTQYSGFEADFFGDDDGPRLIETKTFDDPVPPAQVDLAVGHVEVQELDPLGRVVWMEAHLGSDYTDTLVSAVTYDAFGRVVFATDPFPGNENASTAYGTTYFYNVDGTRKCEIRGHGPQALPTTLLGSTDEASELYPTCFSRQFDHGQQIVGVFTPDALLQGSPQAGVQQLTITTAIGRLVSRSTWGTSARLEHSEFGHDALGHLTTMTRFKNPGSSVTAPSQPVTWNFAYDSLGQILTQHEPGTAVRTNAYSRWGEIIEQRSDDQQQLRSYDGLGRLMHAEQRRAGVVVPGTQYDYTYDVGIEVHPAVPTDYMLGRLATAASNTSTTYFGYDAFGRPVATAHQDPDERLYIETAAFAGDGAVTEVGARLPDTDDALERMVYTYDSARRLESVIFVDEDDDERALYEVFDIDLFGRVRLATLADGRAELEADYATQGRRLLQALRLQAADGRREILITGYDPMGRETGREEKRVDLAEMGTGVTLGYTYDALGRLQSYRHDDEAGTQVYGFAYDALGNVTAHDAPAAALDVALTYDTVDRDRLCSIGYGVFAPSTCNVSHDAFGNVVQYPTRDGTHTLGYLPDGAVEHIARQDGTAATFRYGAFGEVQELDLTGATDDPREDRRYGPFERRRIGADALLTRSFPAGGVQAVRRGATDEWTLGIGEMRGNRFVLDQEGRLVQEMDYAAFGETVSKGEPPTSARYSRDQWNGGDSLRAFGISHLGARMYAPILGRFLSRDRLVRMDTATASNPYSFADNDPINRWDPTGLCPDCIGEEIIEISGTAPSVPPAPISNEAWEHVMAIGNQADEALPGINAPRPATAGDAGPNPYPPCYLASGECLRKRFPNSEGGSFRPSTIHRARVAQGALVGKVMKPVAEKAALGSGRLLPGSGVALHELAGEFDRADAEYAGRFGGSASGSSMGDADVPSRNMPKFDIPPKSPTPDDSPRRDPPTGSSGRTYGNELNPWGGLRHQIKKGPANDMMSEAFFKLIVLRQKGAGQAKLADAYQHMMTHMERHSSGAIAAVRFPALDGSGSIVFAGSAGHAFVITRDGRFFRGHTNDPTQFRGGSGFFPIVEGMREIK